MTTLKPFPAYKDSGVQWLGRIPLHWEARRLSSLLTRNDSGAWGSGDSQDGIKVLRSTEQTANGGWRIENPAVRDLSPAEIAKTILKAGDLVVTTSSGSQKHIGKTSIVTETMEAEGYGFSNFMQRLRTSDQILPRLVWYVINNQLGREQLVYWSTTTTGLANLNGRILGSIALPVPPLDEQRAIADFLDGMDARITRFIAARRKMIALLEEKKQAVINQAVTRGLDPSVPMKESGVDWLGEIPAHWETATLRQTCRLAGGMTPTKSRVEYWRGDIPWVSPKDMKRFRIADAIDHISETAVRDTGLTMLHTGSVLIVVRGMILARKIPIAIAARTLTINQDMKALIPNNRLEPEYLAWTLTSGQEALFPLIDEAGHGTRRLPTPALMSMNIPVPPLDEQRSIIHFLNREVARIDTLISRHRREIELMQEYRTRLISDVVTGKLDARRVKLPAVEEVIGEEIEAAMEDEAVSAGELEEIEA